MVGLFISTSNGTSVVSQTIENLSLSGLTVVGYDLLDHNVRLLKKGVISYLINQNPHLLGSTALNYLLDHLLNKKAVPQQELFPIDIVTRENVESYLQFQSAK
jgi:LacI family transcriptional regulator